MTRAAAWLEGLAPHELAALAARYADALERDGLTVHRAEDGTFHPIPPVLTPEGLSRTRLTELAETARHILSATVKLARWTLTPPGAHAAARLYATLAPLELEALARDPACLERVATARIDYFLTRDGSAHALELNATIPAMQGYSDLIAHRFVRELAAARGLSAAVTEDLVARTGSNTDDLLDSLLAHYRLLGGAVELPSIVIVSRRGDSQLGELHHYVRAFAARGHAVRHAFVDELEIDTAGRVGVGGARADFIYRHIFARRVAPGSTMARLLVDPGPNIVLNPVLAPLEVKGMFALLSAALTDAPALVAEWALTDEERVVAARTIPWTRLVARVPATLADGARVPDLAAWIARHPEQVVLKRSWDYGGKSVVLGPEAETAQARARGQELFGSACDSWPALVAHACDDAGAWVVQEFVPPEPRRHLLLSRGVDGTVSASWRELFVDVSAYANLGVEPRPRGAVCRASASRIVNILGGGGLTPVIPLDVLDTLLR